MKAIPLGFELKVVRKIVVLSFVFIAMMRPIKTDAQLSDDSLKRICVSRFCKSYRDAGYPLRSSDSIYVTAWEVYEGIFTGVKVFSVGQGNCDDCYHGHYTLDIFTGEKPNLKSIEAFNAVMSKNHNGLPNYDKCCFYLYFNGLSGNTTPATLYYKFLVEGSVYRGFPTMVLIRNSDLDVNWRKYAEYIDHSSKRKIYIGAVTKDPLKGKKVTMYEFEFDKNNQITSIKHYDPD